MHYESFGTMFSIPGQMLTKSKVKRGSGKGRYTYRSIIVWVTYYDR